MALPIYLFHLTVHDNGELRLRMAGCTGAEYFIDNDILLARFAEFSALNSKMFVTLLFTKNDEEKGYYFPSDEQQLKWKEALADAHFSGIGFDVANKRAGGGILRVPSFYYDRDNDSIGFCPVAVSYKENGIPAELEKGFDVTKTRSLYK